MDNQACPLEEDMLKRDGDLLSLCSCITVPDPLLWWLSVCLRSNYFRGWLSNRGDQLLVEPTYSLKLAGC